MGVASPSRRPGGFTRFVYAGASLVPERGDVRLRYALDGIGLEETLTLPPVATVPAGREAAVAAALNLLHWVAGLSYWKAGCPPRIDFDGAAPDVWQARVLDTLLREGLAEFAWRNGLDTTDWTGFTGRGTPAGPAPALGLTARSLCPLGGGKDSLVALERLRAAGERVTTIAVGTSRLIAEVAEVAQPAGAAGAGHIAVRRRLAPALLQLNRQGAWNGHVPITAINAAILVLVAVLHDYDSIVFANERSADEATLTGPDGRAVNHQYAKSFAWECLLDDWLRRYVAADVNCFSLLRRERELAVCREFASLTRYHAVFSSCNRNFHLDGPRTGRWCGQCPKCHFVFLGLAPFLAREHLLQIFGADLLADERQLPGFRALLAADGRKPFECVGEVMESRAAMKALAAHAQWRDAPVVRALAPLLESLPAPSLDTLLAPTGPDRIPPRFPRATG